MFWIELSYRYGRTVDELQADISSVHFVELMAAELLDPHGERRSDLRAGIVASVIANAAPFRSKSARPHSPSDFMPDFGQKPKKTSKEIMSAFRTWAEASGGVVKGK